MLPDFPETKSEISRLLNARIRNKTAELSPFASLPRSFTQHEGDVCSYPQDGAGAITQGFERFEVPISVELRELPELVGERLMEKIDQIAEQMARKTAEHGYRALDKAIESGSTSVNADSRPFDQELFLKMIESVDCSFGPDGKPELTFVMHPTTADGLRSVTKAWESDAAFRKRYEDILMIKREAWLDRENNRKLVD